MISNQLKNYILRGIGGTLLIYGVISLYRTFSLSVAKPFSLSRAYSGINRGYVYEIYQTLRDRDEKYVRAALKRYPRILISYVAYAPLNSRDEVHTLCQSNLDFFLRYGVVHKNASNEYSVDYVFHLIGNTSIPKHLVRLALTNSHIYINTGLDYSVDLYAHGETIGKYLNKCDLFAFLNCGSRGPYYPLASATKTEPIEATILWLRPFLEKMQHGAKVVGPTISCEISAHVQSYAMVMDRDATAIAFDYWSKPLNTSKLAIINKSEVGLSAKYLSLGYPIASLDSRHLGRDFRKIPSSACDPEFHGNAGNMNYANPVACPYYANLKLTDLAGCFGQQPCEVGFIKNGGDVVKLNVYPHITRENILHEEQYLDDELQRHLCIRAVYPNKPYLPVSAASSLHESIASLKLKSKSKLIFLFINSSSSLKALSNHLRDEQDARQIFPEASTLLLGLHDASLRKQVDDELSDYRDRYRILTSSEEIYEQYAAYTSQLCYEAWKDHLMASSSSDARTMAKSCELGMMLPLQYYLMDSVLAYFQQHDSQHCQLAFIIDYLAYANHIITSSSKTSALFHSSNDQIHQIVDEESRDVLAYSISTNKLSQDRSLYKKLNYSTTLPRRPSLADYRDATRKILASVSSSSWYWKRAKKAAAVA
jgi:hypothetical protein